MKKLKVKNLKMKLNFFILIFFIFFINTVNAEILVNTRISTNTIMIGDTALLDINVEFSKNMEFIEAKIPKNIDDFEILDYKIFGDTYSKKINIIGAIYKNGDFKIAPIQIIYKDDTEIKSIYSDTVNISVLPIAVNMNESIKDYTAPKLKKYDYTGVIVLIGIILILVLLIALIIYLWRKYFKKKPEVEIQAPQLSPFEIAQMKILKLKNMKFENDEDYKFFAFELSYLIREFVGTLYNIDCLESSNTELKEKIKNIELLKKELFIEINDFLEPIKFAKFKPPIKTLMMYIELTENFVNTVAQNQKNITD